MKRLLDLNKKCFSQHENLLPRINQIRAGGRVGVEDEGKDP
jgi:hypothetical protein